MRKNKIIDSLKDTFRPEFLNRVDEIIVFESLQPKELRMIVDLMLNDTQKVLDDKNIKMFVSDEAKDFLQEKGTDVKYGARPLRRTIEKYIEDALSDKILRNELKNGQKVFVDLDNDQLKFSVE
jgi:ATP-dependent Clp protease ATP-binding subunit ClpA